MSVSVLASWNWRFTALDRNCRTLGRFSRNRLVVNRNKITRKPQHSYWHAYHTGSTFDNHVSLTFDLSGSIHAECRSTAMHCIYLPSLVFLAQAFLQHGHRQTDLPSAGVVTSIYTAWLPDPFRHRTWSEPDKKEESVSQSEQWICLSRDWCCT